MSKHRYYYYDQDSCSFVEVNQDRKRFYPHAVGIATLAVIMAVCITWVFDQTTGTPEEMALHSENQALAQQLAQASYRLDIFQDKLKDLSQSDRRLYRTLLEVQPISDDVRQVGVGGVDPHESFERFDSETASLLQETARQLSEIQRQIRLQNASYRDLSQLAHERENWLDEMPAILPVNGPIVSGFGSRLHPILGVHRMHDGLDFLVRMGSPVAAAGDGVVRRVGGGGGYGIHVEIEHPATGYTTFYAHLSEIPEGIEPGAPIERNEVIAYSGNTGRSTGPHLHYEVRRGGRAINPVHLFAPSMTPQQYSKLLAQEKKANATLDY